MPLNRAGLQALLPHGSEMCLLDRVLQWDAHSIRCVASSHHAPSNPLRGPLGLSSAVAIEYGAQAMALHGALSSGAKPKPAADAADQAGVHGVLAAVRAVVLHVPWLDRCAGGLVVHAALLSGDAQAATYAFEVDVGDQRVAEGRATVVLGPVRSTREAVP